MNLIVIGSSSEGNCYLLKGENSSLIIEAGMKFSLVKEALNFRLDDVRGCIITHEHSDHSKYIRDFINNGIPCYSSFGTFEALNINPVNRNVMQEKKSYKIGEFTVLPFKVEHNANEPFGFLINHKECGNVLFATDCKRLNKRFSNLNNVIIEANYDEEIINNRFIYGKVEDFQRQRVFNDHMSINTCIESLKLSDLKAVNNIILIHLSDGNSSALKFKEKAQEELGKNICIADKNMIIEFNKTF